MYMHFLASHCYIHAFSCQSLLHTCIFSSVIVTNMHFLVSHCYTCVFLSVTVTHVLSCQSLLHTCVLLSVIISDLNFLVSNKKQAFLCQSPLQTFFSCQQLLHTCFFLLVEKRSKMWTTCRKLPLKICLQTKLPLTKNSRGNRYTTTLIFRFKDHFKNDHL